MKLVDQDRLQVFVVASGQWAPVTPRPQMAEVQVGLPGRRGAEHVVHAGVAGAETCFVKAAQRQEPVAGDGGQCQGVSGAGMDMAGVGRLVAFAQQGLERVVRQRRKNVSVRSRAALGRLQPAADRADTGPKGPGGELFQGALVFQRHSGAADDDDIAGGGPGGEVALSAVVEGRVVGDQLHPALAEQPVRALDHRARFRRRGPVVDQHDLQLASEPLARQGVQAA